MSALAVPTPLGKHISAHSRSYSYLGIGRVCLLWLQPALTVSVTLHSLSVFLLTLFQFVTTSLFCRLASIGVICSGCFEPANGTLTPLKLCVWVCVHVHFVRSSFFPSLVYIHMFTQPAIDTEPGKQVPHKIFIKKEDSYFPSLSALSQIHLLANLLQSLLMFCRRLRFYPHTLRVIHLFVSAGFI